MKTLSEATKSNQVQETVNPDVYNWRDWRGNQARLKEKTKHLNQEPILTHPNTAPTSTKALLQERSLNLIYSIEGNMIQTKSMKIYNSNSANARVATMTLIVPKSWTTLKEVKRVKSRFWAQEGIKKIQQESSSMTIWMIWGMNSSLTPSQLKKKPERKTALFTIPEILISWWLTINMIIKNQEETLLLPIPIRQKILVKGMLYSQVVVVKKVLLPPSSNSTKRPIKWEGKVILGLLRLVILVNFLRLILIKSQPDKKGEDLRDILIVMVIIIPLQRCIRHCHQQSKEVANMGALSRVTWDW